MEHLSGGSLTEMLKRAGELGKSINSKEASEIIKRILEAVNYLHSSDIAHRDLKPGMYKCNRR